jgi:hypothetical protein
VRRPGLRSALATSLLVEVAVAGCASPPSPTQSPGTFALPTVTELSDACAGIGLGATLAGSPTDPRVAWITDSETGSRLNVVFPPGFTARFDPSLEVLNATDEVVAKSGDPVTGGCYLGDGQMLVLWQP